MRIGESLIRSFGSLSMNDLMSLDDTSSAGGGCFCTCICACARAIVDDSKVDVKQMEAMALIRGTGLLLQETLRDWSQSIVAPQIADDIEDWRPMMLAGARGCKAQRTFDARNTSRPHWSSVLVATRPAALKQFSH